MVQGKKRRGPGRPAGSGKGRTTRVTTISLVAQGRHLEHLVKRLQLESRDTLSSSAVVNILVDYARAEIERGKLKASDLLSKRHGKNIE